MSAPHGMRKVFANSGEVLLRVQHARNFKHFSGVPCFLVSGIVGKIGHSKILILSHGCEKRAISIFFSRQVLLACVGHRTLKK